MRTSLQLVLGSVEELVSLDEAKAHLRVDLDADDSLIADLITAARSSLEIEMGRAFLTQQWLRGLDAFPPYHRRLALPLPPLQSVESVTYLDVDGVSQTLSTDVYGVDTLSEPGLLYLKMDQVWPYTACFPNAVQIAYTAGWPDVLYVPGGIKSAMQLLVGHWYEHREAAADKALTAIPLGLERLIWLNRIPQAA